MRKIIDRNIVIINKLLEKKFAFLLVAILLLIILPSLFPESIIKRVVSYAVQGLVLFAGIYAVHRGKNELYIGLSIGFIILVFNFLDIFSGNATIRFYLSFLSYMFFYLFLAYRLLRYLFLTEQVTLGVVIASVNAYFLFGIVGGFAFMLIENLIPGSLNNLELEAYTEPAKFVYFSFSSLSTTGFGDITPASPPAQSLTIILGALGPIYLTVIVAIIVGRYVSTHHS